MFVRPVRLAVRSAGTTQIAGYFVNKKTLNLPLAAPVCNRLFCTANKSGEAPPSDASSEGSAAAPVTPVDTTKKLEDEIRSLKDKLLRAYAEEENVRRIAKRDVESAKDYANTKFAKAMLEVADNLDRAVTVVTAEMKESHGDTHFKVLLEGFVLLYKHAIPTFFLSVFPVFFLIKFVRVIIILTYSFSLLNVHARCGVDSKRINEDFF